ncbi:MAG: PTS sugar transporter subunit IIA [Spirochaetaceae bacterium]|jgi:PTS system nitrogen regulatory IIA component|nr:PTS sugar transporter subunit IIA [Spirochaetaceae bacterium]
MIPEDDILTIEEVARYLRVSERTVYDWAQKGDIPAGKIGTSWRFKKADIEKWVNERLTSHADDTTRPVVRVENILSPERIVFLDYPKKIDALSALTENLATAPQVKNKAELLDEMLKRDELMSTAIGQGIAIPHVRLPSITDLVVSIGISKCDIEDFATLDDIPVRLLFMIAAAYNQHAYYLQTLSYFSGRLKNKKLKSALLGAKTGEDAFRILVDAKLP